VQGILEKVAMDKRLLPICCPSCEEPLKVKRFECPRCKAVIEGDFPVPLLARLNAEEQTLLLRFAQCSGSLKELARSCGVSYPTVRNRVDTLIAQINMLEQTQRNVHTSEQNSAV
jgi:hypothetical protein